ncbi:MAG: hypothetical protein CUN56_00475 [Phototrophicales bacterium]|nr:MAG: hypothetical protein CUN56_00475 [Phototrophicales bacterium]
MDDMHKQVVKERGKLYGHPKDSFGRCSAAWHVISECRDAEVRHALYMIWVKICRLVETPDHIDSIIDIAGYAETIKMIHSSRNNNPDNT